MPPPARGFAVFGRTGRPGAEGVAEGRPDDGGVAGWVIPRRWGGQRGQVGVQRRDGVVVGRLFGGDAVGGRLVVDTGLLAVDAVDIEDDLGLVGRAEHVVAGHGVDGAHGLAGLGSGGVDFSRQRGLGSRHRAGYLHRVNAPQMAAQAKYLGAIKMISKAV